MVVGGFKIVVSWIESESRQGTCQRWIKLRRAEVRDYCRVSWIEERGHELVKGRERRKK